MKKIKVALIGANGKMGQDLQSLIKDEAGFELVARVSREKQPNMILLSDLDGASVDGVIDFSSPENLAAVLKWCMANKKPVVVGTTGFTHSPKTQLEEAAKQIPVLWSPNMSLGIAYLQQAIRHFSLIHDFDFQIEEVHHTKKKDAPSGTALFLQNELKAAIGKEPPEVLSIRAGQIFGIHRVMAFGPDETLVLEHQALNRRVFSKGAMKALQWLVHQKNGFYSLSNVLVHREIEVTSKQPALLISVRTYGGEGLSLMKEIVRELLGSITDLEVSSVFQTKGTSLKPRHVHDLKGTNEFEGLAACLRGQTELSAHEVLDQLQRTEARHKNEALRRSAVLNLLVFGNQTLMTPELTIPHPEFHRQPEQLIPAAEIWADCRHPILHLTLQALVPKLSSENTMEFYAQGKSLLDF